jgi:hypothetical protein
VKEGYQAGGQYAQSERRPAAVLQLVKKPYRLGEKSGGRFFRAGPRQKFPAYSPAPTN